MKQHYVVIHAYILNRALQIQIISCNTAQRVSYICWVIIQDHTHQEVPVLSPITANILNQLSRILTDNLNLKAPS